MRVGKLSLIFVFLLIISMSVFAAQKYDYSNLKAGEDYAVNSVIIKFNPSTKIKNFQEAKNIINKLDKDEKELRKLTSNYGETTYGSNYLYSIQYKKNIDVSKKIDQLSKHNEIEYAEPDIIFHSLTNPNDPQFTPSGWHFWNFGQSIFGFAGRVDADIDAPEAWDITTGSSSVKIGIIDSGINSAHPDLSSKVDILPGADVMIQNTAANFCDEAAGEDCDNIAGDDPPFDVFGHGTSMSGIAAAATNNGIGISGVCWNCRIVPIKACYRNTLSDMSCRSQNVISAINFAIDNDVKILSASYGSPSYIQSLQDSINDAWTNNNIIFVASAGNNGNSVLIYPSAYNNVIRVAATNNSDNKAYFSNYGTTVDISAPGQQIPTTTLSGSYGYDTGTSPSSPIIAGILGLMWSRNPSLTNAQLRDILLNNTDNIDALNPTQCGGSSCIGLIGSGRANAYKAVLDSLPSPPLLNPIGNKIVNENSLLSFTLTASDSNLDPLAFSKDNPKGTLNQNSGLFTWTPSTIDIGNYQFNFSVNDSDLVWPSQYDSEIINIKVNDIPYLETISEVIVNEDALVVITANAVDVDDTPTYSINDSRFIQNNNIFTWQTNYDDSGIYYVRITASDPTSSVYQDVKITVNNVNRPPVMQFIPTINVNENDLITITAIVTDPDNQNSVTNDDNIITYSINNSIFNQDNNLFTWQTNYDDSGIYYVTVSSSDGEFIVAQVVQINVNNFNRPPVLQFIPNITKNETDIIKLQLIASDPDNQNSVTNDDNVLTYSTNFMNFISYLNNNIFRWQPTYNDSGIYDITASVSDGTNVVGQMFRLIVNNSEPPAYGDSGNSRRRYVLYPEP